MTTDVPDPRPSLRSRLLRRLVPPILALFVASGALSYVGARYHADSVHDRWLVDSVEALAQRVVPARGGAALDLPEAARQLLQWDAADTTWFQVIGPGGEHLAGHPSVPGPAPRSDVDHLRQARLWLGGIAGAPVRVASVVVTVGTSEEAVEVRVAETLRKRQTLAAELLLSVIVPQLVLLAVALAVIRVTLRKLLAPVGTVASALEAQTHHSLEPVDDRALPAEMVPLTHALNALLLRLRDALAAQRDFIADAAHQLRTPLTALKLAADEAARETDPDRLALRVRELQREADRSARLAQQMLALARAEPAARIAEPRRFDLRALVHEAAAHWVPAALRRGIDLGFDEAPDAAAPIEALGDPGLFAEAVGNLLDNALGHCGPGTSVTVSVDVVGAGVARVRVTDDGPGIAPEDRRRVLERFQRGGRAAGGGGALDRTPGTGLGLAIVAGIVRGHGGEVRIEAGPDGRGTRVTLELPLAAAVPGEGAAAQAAAAAPRAEAA